MKPFNSNLLVSYVLDFFTLWLPGFCVGVALGAFIGFLIAGVVT